MNKLQENKVVKKKENFTKRRTAQVELLKNSPVKSLDQALDLILALDNEKKNTVVNSVALTINLRGNKPIAILGNIKLPHNPSRKIPSIGVFARGVQAEEALAAGADHVGGADFIEKIKGGEIKYDFYIASKDMNSEVSSVARILGPIGKLPNIKNNTLTDNIKASIDNIRAGQRNIKKDPKSKVLHIVIGNTKNTASEIKTNLGYLLKHLFIDRDEKRLSTFIRTALITSTQSPSIPLHLSYLINI